MDKKGFLHMSNINKYIYGFVGLIVLFLVVAELLPEAQSAGTSMENLTVLGNLFAADGVVWIAVVAGILLVVLAGVLGGAATGHKKK